MAGLSREQFAALSEARTAVLTTVASDGLPRPVPICYVLAVTDDGRHAIFSPIDEKPKAGDDPLALARVRDIQADPRVSVLIDRWSEDWSQLGWLRIDGTAAIVEPTPPIVTALRTKYPQYLGHRLEDRPMIRIVIDRVRSWGTLAGGSEGTDD